MLVQLCLNFTTYMLKLYPPSLISDNDIFIFLYICCCYNFCTTFLPLTSFTSLSTDLLVCQPFYNVSIMMRSPSTCISAVVIVHHTTCPDPSPYLYLWSCVSTMYTIPPFLPYCIEISAVLTTLNIIWHCHCHTSTSPPYFPALIILWLSPYTSS